MALEWWSAKIVPPPGRKVAFAMMGSGLAECSQNLQIPPFKYFPASQWEREGPKQWARIRLLQACHRLQIAKDKWPEFEGHITTPGSYEQSYQWPRSYELPVFRALHESSAEWKLRAQADFDEHCYRFIQWVESQIEIGVRKGDLRKVPQPRHGSVPLELRYEWVARHCCLREQYKSMASDEHSADKIRKTVNEILKLVEMKQRK